MAFDFKRNEGHKNDGNKQKIEQSDVMRFFLKKKGF